MSIETNLRAGLEDLADDARPVPGLAAAALRQGRRRRNAARGVLTAGAVAAAAVPAGVIWLGDDDDPAGFVAAGSDIVPAPEWRELTGDELSTAVEACFPGRLTSVPDPVRGIQLAEPSSPTWVITGTGVMCALPGGGGPPRLQLAQVVEERQVLEVDDGLGAGSYTDPVTRVTVRYEGGPEHEAVLWDGLWFDPLDHARQRNEHDPCEGQLPYVVRGYDAEGRLVSEVAYGTSVDGTPIAEEPRVAVATCPP
ncbi:hypothetical protein [Jiangella anatolica]|uniref:Uncharacterized protein n=1 Tax=Jiangella anatolica TaxID=2670374 RepID=A0A2W2C4C0_9ACTN|nr:hypothetical protein [Jiangella anatolica]PZF80596.1 hypothetical protein C1I92_25290 [Jiangella anatolica]